MAELVKRKVLKVGGKVTAEYTQEREETRIGRYLGFKKEELELLFKNIKQKKMRITILNNLAYEAKTNNRPLSELIKKLIAERERLR